jgi:hypothetical protein
MEVRSHCPVPKPTQQDQRLETFSLTQQQALAGRIPGSMLASNVNRRLSQRRLEGPLPYDPIDPCKKPTTTRPAAGATAVAAVGSAKSQQLQAWLCKVQRDREAKLKEWLHGGGSGAWYESAAKAGASVMDEPKCFNCGSICARLDEFLDTDTCFAYSFQKNVSVAACRCVKYLGFKRGATPVTDWITLKDLGVP